MMYAYTAFLRRSTYLRTPSASDGGLHTRHHRFPSTALRTPATQGTHMSPMIYRLILRLTAPEEFEDKPADDEIE
jgi:hypothetical protein